MSKRSKHRVTISRIKTTKRVLSANISCGDLTMIFAKVLRVLLSAAKGCISFFSHNQAARICSRADDKTGVFSEPLTAF